jgi:thymidylate synthase (FAD)
MKIVEPHAIIETPIHGQFATDILVHLERCARTCYKSEGYITPGSAPGFISNLIRMKKHESIIEHASATVRFICDRGVTHEIVRHRLAAYSQESTRYCNYTNDKFDNEITVIRPLFFEEGSEDWNDWYAACKEAEARYMKLISRGRTPQEARSVLPNSLKTELVMTCNMREWRHVFSLRTSSRAHPQMTQVMRPLLAEFKTHLEPLFGDLGWGVTVS